MLTKVSTDKAPAAIGPYSQGIIAGDFLFASGQIPIDPATGEIKGGDVTEQAEQAMKNVGAILAEAGTDYAIEAETIEEQTEQVCKNLGAVLEAAGTSYENVLKTTCFLADMGDFAAFNEVYAKYFTSKPARSCVAVKQLPKDVLCEVEVLAYLG